ncbi:MAG: hypothetical protein ACRD0B_07385, partial [Acidimicrobiales bacterium]
MRQLSYSRWDGSQAGFDLDAEAVLAEINDDLLYHGDVGAALRRLLSKGFTDRTGRHVEGLRELVERLREARRQMRQRYDLGGVCSEIAEELDSVVSDERAALERLRQEAASSGDERRREVTTEHVARQQSQLSLLGED